MKFRKPHRCMWSWQAENIGAVQAGDEKVAWKHHSTFQDLKGPTGKPERYSPSRTGVTGQGTTGSNSKRGNKIEILH